MKDKNASMYQISNDQLTISISATGAELQGIYHRENKQEYLWSGNPAFWGKKSPVLFPIVGGLKDNSYVYEGNLYEMSRHGFAREKVFTVTEQTPHQIHFTLLADEETRKIYPFDFCFSVIYSLQDNRLTVTYQVDNTGNKTLWFSVGAHPAFAVPLVKGTEFPDHYLEFSEKESTGIWPLTREGLIRKAPEPFLENTDHLPLMKELFYKDALVFKSLRSNSIAIRNLVNNHGIKLQFDGFPYMGIWSARNADFVCIEPWCGIADTEEATGDITQKEGINSLHPDGSFVRSWQVKIF